MKRKRLYFLVLIVLLLLILPRLVSRESSYFSVIEANWGLTFPTDANWEEVYQTDSGASFHGDGWRYHVFAYEKEEIVSSMLPWTQETGETIYSEGYQEAAEAWLDKIDVPDEMRPDYVQCLVWYTFKADYSQILIFWDSTSQAVYVAEIFI